MNFLIDSHIYLWLNHSPKPGAIRRSTLELLADPQNELYVSIVSLWELQIKKSLNKLDVPNSMFNIEAFPEFALLALEPFHVHTLRKLDADLTKPIHRDPFDRIMLAQAIAEGLTFVTHDRNCLRYAANGLKLMAA